MTSASWTAVAGGAVGSRHVRRGEPSEDAYAAATTPIPFVVLSDGHGSDRCTRASRGSELAVEVAVALIQQHPETTPGRAFIAAIVEEWRERCARHLAENPMSAQEEAVVLRAKDIGWLLLYGTTLLFAAVHRNQVRGFRIGDGEVMLRRPNGSVEVVPPIAGLVDTETESLCLPDATQHASYCSWDLGSTGGELVLVATDGFGGAFETPDWHKPVVDDVLAYVEDAGVADLDNALAGWCNGPAEVGGDDASLGLLVRRELP